MAPTLKFIKTLHNPLGLTTALTSLVSDNRETMVDDLLTLVSALPAYIVKPFQMHHIYSINMDTTDGINLITGSFIPGKLMISTEPSLSFTIDPIKTYRMQTKIKVVDRKDVDELNNITFEVLACNNALDDVPTWENITEAYQVGVFYNLKNILKTNSEWALGIKMTMTKNEDTAEVELTDIYIAHL